MVLLIRGNAVSLLAEAWNVSVLSPACILASSDISRIWKTLHLVSQVSELWTLDCPLKCILNSLPSPPHHCWQADILNAASGGGSSEEGWESSRPLLFIFFEAAASQTTWQVMYTKFWKKPKHLMDRKPKHLKKCLSRFIMVTMQVPLPSLPFLPSDLPLWNLRPPPRFQWGHRGRRRRRLGRNEKERSCEMSSASPFQWLLLPCMLYQVIVPFFCFKTLSQLSQWK